MTGKCAARCDPDSLPEAERAQQLRPSVSTARIRLFLKLGKAETSLVALGLPTCRDTFDTPLDLVYSPSTK
jgi:hypothetical protein